LEDVGAGGGLSRGAGKKGAVCRGIVRFAVLVFGMGTVCARVVAGAFPVGVVVMMVVAVLFGSVAGAEVISGCGDGNAFVLDIEAWICGRFGRGGGRGW
jgi:hypothetical protein